MSCPMALSHMGVQGGNQTCDPPMRSLPLHLYKLKDSQSIIRSCTSKLKRVFGSTFEVLSNLVANPPLRTEATGHEKRLNRDLNQWITNIPSLRDLQ